MSVAASVAVIVVVAQRVQKRLDSYVLALLALALTASVFVSARSSEFLTFANVVFSLSTILIALREVISPKSLKLKDYFVVPIALPIDSLSSFSKLLPMSNLRLTRSLSDTQQRVLKGLALSAPLLLIFGLLFSSADAVFADIFSGLFDVELNFSGEFIGRTVAFLSILALTGGALTYVFLKKHFQGPKEQIVPAKERSIELSIMLGSLNALFLIFIAIQAVYLFGGREVVLDGELTFAEYGRRGFFELLAVSAMTFALIYYVRRYFQSAQSQLPKILSIVLVAQVGIIMVSALRRLALYEDVFGFTLLRFYSHSFIFFLVAAFALLVYAVVRHISEQELLRSYIITAGVYLLALNIVSPDAFIAQQNLDRFKDTGKIDAYYGYSLSADAFEQKVEGYKTELATGSETTNLLVLRDVVCDDVVQLENDTDTWSTTNFSRESVRTTLKSDFNIECADYRERP